jgi:hypothetical protein
MRYSKTTLAIVMVALFLAGITGAAAQKEPSQDRAVDQSRFSGFLDDYERLESIADDYVDLVYLKPDLFKELANYDGIMIDQPEILIHPESAYQGMKPDDMKILADAFREAVTTEIKDFPVVEKSGPKVLYVRIGLTGVYLKKKRSKNPLAYTPVGFVASSTKKAMTKDITKKILLVEANIEWQLMDSETGEVLAAVVEQRGALKDKEKQQKADPTSWDELDDIFREAGVRLSCRLDNATKPEAEQVDCRNIPKAAE